MSSINKQKPDLGNDPITGLIAKFAVPSIISMLVNAAYNITDQIFIGNVEGFLGNAATNIAFPVVSISLAFAQMSGVGSAANFNICLGAGKKDEARQFIGNGLTLTGILGVFLCLTVIIFKAPLLYLFGATEAALPYASAYLGITAFSIPFQMFVGASGVLIRADGSPSYSMLCTVSGAVLNIFLDALFMSGFGWGIQGAAIATVCGQLVSFMLCLSYYPRFKTFRIELSSLRLKASYVLKIVKLGTTNFINHMIMALVNIVMNNTLKYYGSTSVYGSDIPLAVAGIIAKLNSLLVSFVVGLAQGCQPIWSFNMGAKNYRRVKETYKKAVSAAIVFSITAFILFQAFPREITSIFGTGSELYFQFAEQYLRIYMMMVCLFGIQPLTTNYFPSIGESKRGIILSLSRQGFLLLPLLIIFPILWGLDGALYAGPVADSLAAALSVSFVAASFKQLTKAEKKLKEAAVK